MMKLWTYCYIGTPGLAARFFRSWREPLEAGVESAAKRRRQAGQSIVVSLLCLLAGCGWGADHQSMVHPASEAAAEVARLWWFMFALFTAVFVIVMGFLLAALLRGPENAAPPGGNTRFVVWGGILIPGLIMVGMLIYSLKATVALRMPETKLRIQVIGHQWWWEVRYPEENIVTANELYIPAGEPVQIELRAADVIHSFWVPNLQGKRDMLPEVTNYLWLRAERPGIFRGQCAEFCGVQHALMAFMVVALPPEEFQAWVDERQQPSPAPETEWLQRGRAVFFEAACHNCHAIGGIEAEGLIGPDLTHMGSRLTVGAGTLTNSPGNLSGWIANPQALKPGNRMPRSHIGSEDLHALVDYLFTLR
jgi:cytochrome c oxidase subunit II